MAQWTNLNRKNNFVNPWRLPLSCGISGVLHLVLVGLMTGWLAGRRNSRKFEICYRQKYSTFRFVKRYRIITAVPMHLSWFFS